MKFKNRIKVGKLKLAYIMAVTAMMAGIAGMLVVNADFKKTKSCSANLENKLNQFYDEALEHMKRTGQTEYERKENYEKVEDGKKMICIEEYRVKMLSADEEKKKNKLIQDILSRNYNKNVVFEQIEVDKLPIRKMETVVTSESDVQALREGGRTTQKDVIAELIEQEAKCINDKIENGEITEKKGDAYVIKQYILKNLG